MFLCTCLMSDAKKSVWKHLFWVSGNYPASPFLCPPNFTPSCICCTSEVGSTKLQPRFLKRHSLQKRGVKWSVNSSPVNRQLWTELWRKGWEGCFYTFLYPWGLLTNTRHRYSIRNSGNGANFFLWTLNIAAVENHYSRVLPKILTSTSTATTYVLSSSPLYLLEINLSNPATHKLFYITVPSSSFFKIQMVLTDRNKKTFFFVIIHFFIASVMFILSNKQLTVLGQYVNPVKLFIG